MGTGAAIDLLNLQDSTRRLPCAELGSEVGCCGYLELMYYVNYAAQNNDLGQFLGVSNVNNYDATDDNPENKYLSAVRFIVGPCNQKLHDKNVDKKSKNKADWSSKCCLGHNKHTQKKITDN